MRATKAARLLAVTAVLAVAGCGQESIPPAVDVTGTWVGSIESTTGPPGYDPNLGQYTMTLVLTQSGANVTGTVSSDSAYKGTLAGAVAGSRLQAKLTVNPCGGAGQPVGTLNLSGVVAATGTIITMQVDYMGDACGVVDYGAGTLTKQ
jgi:hypothetical protein